MEQIAYDYAAIIESDETVFYIEVYLSRFGGIRSDFFSHLSDAYKAFDETKDLVKYYGGGTVELVAKYKTIYTTVCVAII